MRKEFETIAQYKEQMRAMLDKAEAEKKSTRRKRERAVRAVENKERTFGNES